MSDTLFVLFVGSLAAGLTMLGGLVAEFRDVPKRVIARLLQLAAGVLTALVAVTLMQPALAGGYTIPIIAGFFVGGAAFVILDFVTSKREAANKSDTDAVPSSLYLGILVDMLIDGVVIGLASTMTLTAGLILALSIAISTAPLALVTISLAREVGESRRFRQVLFALFFACIVGGALFGYLVLRNQSLNVRFVMVAVASGFLITTVTQSIIPEANREGEPSLAALFFVAGLSFYALFTLQFT
ncbi:MAG: hypothetical protein U0452_01335 [Anaerolineae bacterium]